MENRLLGTERLYRMAESVSLEDALRIFSETGFGEGVNLANAIDFEELIDAERIKLVGFIKETCASETFKSFFLLKNDFHNAEAFIKSKHLRFDASAMTVEDGLIDKNVMKEKIMTDDYDGFPSELATALKIIDNEFVFGNATGFSVGSLIKKALYVELLKNAKKNKYLTNIYRVKADAVNISLALRTRDFGKASGFFVSGGMISEGELKVLCEENVENLREKTKYFSRADLIELALNDFLNSKPLSELEKFVDGYAVLYLKKNKYETEGIFPYMLYCYYKSAEIDNVRIIMVGLINGTSSSVIKRSLRDSYEG